MIDRRKLYDLIYNRVDKIIKKYNPCNIQLKNKGVVCKRGRLCCDGCFYLSDNGCTTNCLGCKFTFCPYLDDDKTIHQIVKLLRPLYVLAFINDFIYIRSSKEEILTKVNLTKDRDVKYRNVYNADTISYFPYTVDRKLIDWRKQYEQ